VISRKAEIYAENRAPEYWIVDLASRSVFVHTDPVVEGTDRWFRFDAKVGWLLELRTPVRASDNSDSR
jgi:Uma2 family endonuclease